MQSEHSSRKQARPQRARLAARAAPITAGDEDVPVLDELAYYDALVARRPDLIATACWAAWS